MNIWTATNHPAAAYIEEKDARYWVLEASEHRVGDHDYFAKVLKEINNGGREAFAHLLLNRDISKFVPMRDVPKNNAAKREMIKAAINPYDARKWLEACCHTKQIIGFRDYDCARTRNCRRRSRKPPAGGPPGPKARSSTSTSSQMPTPNGRRA